MKIPPRDVPKRIEYVQSLVAGDRHYLRTQIALVRSILDDMERRLDDSRMGLREPDEISALVGRVSGIDRNYSQMYTRMGEVEALAEILKRSGD